LGSRLLAYRGAHIRSSVWLQLSPAAFTKGMTMSPNT
jgi:hypothetical protein